MQCLMAGGWARVGWFYGWTLGAAVGGYMHGLWHQPPGMCCMCMGYCIKGHDGAMRRMHACFMHGRMERGHGVTAMQ